MKKLLSLVLALALTLSLGSVALANSDPAMQEIIFALQNEPDGIDPSVTNNSFASPFMANCFEGLVTYDTVTGDLIGGGRA